MTLGELLADAARSLVGVPFRWQGRSATTGVDCAGLVIVAAHQAGIPIIEVAQPDYSRRSDSLLSRIEAVVICNSLERFDYSSQSCGEIMVVNYYSSRPHILICTGQSIVHAHASLGRVVECDYDLSWKLIEALRFKQ